MKTIILALFLVLASALSAFGSACITTTYDNYLVPNLSCGIGDLGFNNFFYSTAGTDLMPPASVMVNPVTNQYDTGLLFNAPWGVQSGQSQDSLVGFTVTAGSGEISELTLYMFGAGAVGTGQVSVAETYCAGDTFADLCANGIEGTLFTMLNGSTSILHASATFAPVKIVDVMKDIELTAGRNGSASLLSGVENLFAVPEPGSMVLLGAGSLALAGALRRKLML